MARQKKGTYTSVFFVILMGVVGIVWFFYTEKSAAPPLPQTTMPVVFNAKWDGSVWQIKDWLKKNSHIPATLSVTHWGKVTNQKDGYTVLVKFKEKNTTGAYTELDKLFTLDPDGDIVGVINIKAKAH